MKRSSYIAPLLVLLLLSFGLKELCGQDKAKEKKDEKKVDNPWEVNPFARNKYIQPYPPTKVAYGIEDNTLVYRGTYSYEILMDDKLALKEDGEDLIIDFLLKDPARIDLPTGNKYGTGTLKEELKLLNESLREKEKAEDKVGKNEVKNSIKRVENMIKILSEKRRKVSVFDGLRYRQRRPTAYYSIAENNATDMTKQLREAALLGYSHGIQEFQIDEAGILTEEGGRMFARDDSEDMSRRAGNVYMWWKGILNHWWDLEEFPMLPPDIDYIRERRFFFIENITADWDVTLKESKKMKSMEPVDQFFKRYLGRGIKDIFTNAQNLTYATMGPIIDYEKEEIKKMNVEYKKWVVGDEYKKQLATSNIYTYKPGMMNRESEALAIVKENQYAFQHNDCQFVAKEDIEITEDSGKKVKYDGVLHFRRDVALDNLMLPNIEIIANKWQDDIWFDSGSNLPIKRQFSLDLSIATIQQVPNDPRNPQAGTKPLRNTYICKYAFALSLVKKKAGRIRDAELKVFKNIVNSFNKAVGPEYQDVLKKLESYKTDYVDKVKNHDLASTIETMTSQCKNVSDIFTVSKGFKKNNSIYTSEYFCTYVPEDFNPEEKYGLIFYLPDEKENVEERIKEIGSLLLGKKFIAVGYSPAMNKYSHQFEQTSKSIINALRGISKTYNIDPARRYLLGVGQGAQMALTMIPYTLSDFDRFSLYIPLTPGYLPFADDCRKNINGPQGGNFQQAIFSSNLLVMHPKGTSGINPTGEAPDACIALGGAFANVRVQNPKFDKYVSRLIHSEKDVYNKNVASYILNQIIPKFEKDAKSFFETPANTPGLQALAVATQAPAQAGTPAPAAPAPAKEEAPKKDTPAEKKK